MPKPVYTPEMIEFLRTGFKEMRLPALTAAFNKRFGLNKTREQLKTAITNRKIRCGRPSGLAKGEGIRLLTPEQIDFIKGKYRALPLKKLLEALNKKFGLALQEKQLRSFISNHGILSGRTGCFEKKGPGRSTISPLAASG